MGDKIYYDHSCCHTGLITMFVPRLHFPWAATSEGLSMVSIEIQTHSCKSWGSSSRWFWLLESPLAWMNFFGSTVKSRNLPTQSSLPLSFSGVRSVLRSESSPLLPWHLPIYPSQVFPPSQPLSWLISSGHLLLSSPELTQGRNKPLSYPTIETWGLFATVVGIYSS